MRRRLPRSLGRMMSRILQRDGDGNSSLWEEMEGALWDLIGILNTF